MRLPTPRRALAGVAALVGLLMLLSYSGDDLWTPIDRRIPSLDRQDGPLRIIVFGTSLTANGSWPDRLADRLTACLSRPVSVTRVARPGANARWGLTMLDAVAATKPDVVLIEFAVNDADLRDGLWPADSRAAHAAILKGLTERLPDARLALMTMNPAWGLRGWMRPRLPGYYAAYSALADAAGAGLIDLYAKWQARPNLRASIPDGLHPDDAIAAALIVPEVAAAIAAAAGGACA